MVVIRYDFIQSSNRVSDFQHSHSFLSFRPLSIHDKEKFCEKGKNIS